MQAKEELTQLRGRLSEQITALESEMAIVDKTIELLEREDRSSRTASRAQRFRKVGLSDAIRQIVASEWVSPTEVRDELMRGGYPNGDKSKLLGSVFATMKRLGNSVLEVKRIDDKLKYRAKPASSANAKAAGSQHVNGSGPLRKTQIHEWLKANGPAMRKAVVDGTGIPDGTVGSYLNTQTDLFEKRDGRWHAR
jgi:hypothetical protein